MAEIEVRQIGADGWQLMREVRLAALLDAPEAFSSSYQREAGFGPADWLGRITQGANFLAYATGAGSGPAGIVGGFVPSAGIPELVSMWVAPDNRGAGVGRALVEAVVRWARAEGHHQLRLWVTEGNEPARVLYGRCGFTPTGERQPLASRPEFTEIAMTRSV
jgi:GNAT superfamily N-acetyltransferase